MSIYAGMDDSYGPAGRRPRGAPSPLWDTSDGRMHLAIGDFHHWTEAKDILGLPDIGRQPELIPDFGRHGQNLLPVFAAVAETLPKMDRWDVFFNWLICVGWWVSCKTQPICWSIPNTRRVNT